MKHLRKFNESSEIKRWDKWFSTCIPTLPTLDDLNTDIIDSVKSQDYSVLPNWVWDEVESIYPLEEKWVELIYGEDDKELIQKIEIELSQIAQNITDKLVRWRDRLMPDVEYYDEKISDSVTYFIMTLQRTLYKDEIGWYKSAYSTPSRLENFRRTREIIRNKLKDKRDSL